MDIIPEVPSTVGLIIRWVTIKTVGIYIGTDLQQMTEQNFTERLNKIQTLTDLWCLRKLTLQAKISSEHFNNATYAISMLSNSYPSTYNYQINRNNIKIYMERQTAKSKIQCHHNDIQNGGLRLQDLETKIRSLHIQWIKTFNESNAKPHGKNMLAQNFMTNNI